MCAGSHILENGLLFKELLQTPNFRITVVDDADTVELCGALKVSWRWNPALLFCHILITKIN